MIGSANVIPSEPLTDSEAARLTALAQTAVLGTAPTERFERIATLAQQLLGAEFVGINFVDDTKTWAKALRGDLPRELPHGYSFCEKTIEAPGPYAVSDARTDPRFRGTPLSNTRIRSYAGYPITSPDGQRIGAVCVADQSERIFTSNDLAVLEHLASWVEEELRRTVERTESRRVQQGLLPKPLVTLSGYQVAGISSPVADLGGDFYDWYPVSGGAAFTLADVMGKGTPAALIAATVRAVMRAGSRTNGVSAAVEAAAESLEADFEGSDTFATLFHAHLDETTGVVRYIDAGHGLTLVVHANGSSERLASTGMPLGASWDFLWDEQRAHLAPGDTLVSVSDGILDAFDGTIGALRHVDDIVRTSSTAQETVERLMLAVGLGAPDDVTAIVIRRDLVTLV